MHTLLSQLPAAGTQHSAFSQIGRLLRNPEDQVGSTGDAVLMRRLLCWRSAAKTPEAVPEPLASGCCPSPHRVRLCQLGGSCSRALHCRKSRGCVDKLTGTPALPPSLTAHSGQLLLFPPPACARFLLRTGDARGEPHVDRAFCFKSSTALHIFTHFRLLIFLPHGQ